ncbi:mitochondrial dynamin GTPase Msp1 [Oleoguttula sp. CCFEE 5521]
MSRLLSSRLTTPLLRSTIRSTRQDVVHPTLGGAPIAHRTLTSSVLSRTTPRIASRWRLRRSWPYGSNAIHNLPAVRSISFARVLPSLAMKLIRIPAMFGAAMIGGVTYLQYQAGQAGAWMSNVFGKATETVGSTASGIMEGAGGIFSQLGRGWDKTKEDVSGVQMPAWMREIYEGRGGAGGDGGGGGPEPQQSHVGLAGAGAATAAAFALDGDGEQDMRSEESAARDDQMMVLTKKMIEIRSLLQTIGQSESLTLPSIVVVGSQSSGKSSVLEAIVGHEFLPKGSNMVTRRPIELTLVNTPKAHAEYGEFPALGLGKITDFSQIQKTLTDLNLAVPEKDCVSDDPIQLRICSPNVPDLSLIDLPGYIQVEAFDQPTELKTKIQELCDKYIQPPNVILAISAADVDLANSTALRASRRVDPRGERTIGVVTKMDLVDPVRGAQILTDKNYPLRLGYVGVVCKVPQETKSLFSRGSANIMNAITKNETAYFGAHPDTFGQNSSVTTGTPNLRKKLMHVLEATMSASLATTSEAIQHELAEATYEFKVQYNERPLSAESYLAESLDAFKHSFKGLADTFGRREVREIVKSELDQQVLNLLAQRYWNRPITDLRPLDPLTESLQDPLESLPKADPENPLWHLKLDASTSTLTKLGIGRLATSITAQSLQTSVRNLIQGSTFSNHPFAIQAITQASETILQDLSYDTSDELEICLKPYKYRIELDDAEWRRGRENITAVLKQELQSCDAATKFLDDQIGGRRKAKDVVSFIDRVRKGEVVLEGDGSGGAGGFSAALLAKGREAVFLRDRAEILRMRLTAVKSRQCGDKKNKYYCPEIFLDAVADKLTSTADLFLDAELLSKFYYQFPRRLEQQFRQLDEATLERFAREDPKVRKHLDVVRRKEGLERVLKEMEGLRGLEERARRSSSRGTQTSGEAEGKRRRGWGLFQRRMCLAFGMLGTIYHLLTSFDLGPFTNFSTFKDHWFAHFWTFFGPRSREAASAVVTPLISNAATGICLDIGPGSGQWLSLFAKASNPSITKIYGVEPNVGLHKELRANAVKAGLGNVYEVLGVGAQDLGSVGLERGSVDTIITVQVLCSVPKPEEIIKSLYPYLKPGGKWLVFEHVKTHYREDFVAWWQRTVNTVWPQFFNGCDICRPTDEWLLQAGEWEEVNLKFGNDEGKYDTVPHAIGTLTKKM